jgi:choline dehydrogenase
MYNDHSRDIIQKEGFAAVANGTRPRSTSTVKLASSDPMAVPLIDPNYLTDPCDMEVLRRAIRIAQPAFDDFRGPEYKPGAAMQSDTQLDEWIRATACTMYHVPCRRNLPNGKR